DRPGLTVTEILDGALDGRIRALWILGENAAMTDPDLAHVRRCLEACEFLVVQEIFPSETARFAHVVLPAAASAERAGTFTNTERRVQRFEPAVEPPGTPDRTGGSSRRSASASAGVWRRHPS